jgi:hypothetical protein
MVIIMIIVLAYYLGTILKIFPPKKIETNKFFTQKLDHSIGFYEKLQFFSQKIAEISYHNIEPLRYKRFLVP